MNTANVMLAELSLAVRFGQLQKWDAERIRMFFDKLKTLLRERGFSDGDIEAAIEMAVKAGKA